MLVDAANVEIIEDCDFESNVANHGGGLYLNNIVSTTEIVNCRFYNNHANGFGGGAVNSSSNPIFRNCTFYGNTADREGGAISNLGGESQVINSILWQNTPFEISDLESDTTITYSVITGGWDGIGNLDIDPNFINESTGDLRLAPNSPAIDAGNNDAVLTNQLFDLDFNPRKSDDPDTPDTGNGTAPLVDLGCYEYQGITTLTLLDPQPGTAGQINQFRAINAQPGERIWFSYGLLEGSTNVPGCPNLTINIAAPKSAGHARANSAGSATINRYVPNSARGIEILLQGVSAQRCTTTPLRRTIFD